MSWMTIYSYCIGIGLVLLIITLVLDAFDSLLESLDSLFDAIDLDFFDLDVGGISLALLPISLRAVCLASVVFGSVSTLMINTPIIVRHVIAGILAYISAVIIQTAKKYLKAHQSLASNKELLLMSESTVINTIADSGFGSISTPRINDSSVSSTAKSFDGNTIKQGTKVKVIEIKNDYVIVKPL